MHKNTSPKCHCENDSFNTTTNKSRSWDDEKVLKELTNRLNRIEGQVRGIRGMIERNAYCDDVLNQITSATAALRGVAKLLLQKHMKACVRKQLQAGDDQVIDEVINTIFRMMR